jgi:hypothetical protein
METPKEYYYTYYSYEEWGMGYFGSRKCYCLPKEDIKYFGSSKDKSFKPTQKIILKSDYATREEAYADEIILQQYYKVVENPHFANRAYQTSTKFYLPKEQLIANGKKNGKIGGKIGGKKSYELGVGVHGISKERRSEIGKKTVEIHKERGIGLYGRTQENIIKTASKAGKIGGAKVKELGVGIFALTPEQRSINAKIAGKVSGQKHKENKTGVCGRSKEKMIEDGKKGAQKAKELGVGIFALTPEQKSEAAKKASKNTNSQKWMCLETGFVTNSGALTSYQKKRGIDTSRRKRIS